MADEIVTWSLRVTGVPHIPGPGSVARIGYHGLEYIFLIAEVFPISYDEGIYDLSLIADPTNPPEWPPGSVKFVPDQ